jgi:hypothetical protein
MPEADVATVLARIAAHGLPGSSDEPFAVDARAWPTVATSVTTHRLTGVAIAARQEGVLELEPPATEDLTRRHRDQMMHALAIERWLFRLTEDLESQEIASMVLKGPALAHTHYPDPSWRAFGDLDLLVRGQDLSRATAVFERHGFRRDLPEPARGFDVRFGKAITFSHPDGLQVDLHRTLALGPFGLWLDAEELHRTSDTFALGGREFRRLTDTAQLLHTCVHAILGWDPPLPMPMRDVAQVAWCARVDWPSALELAARWRLVAVVQRAFEQMVDRLGIPVPPAAAPFAEARPGPRELEALERYAGARRRGAGLSIATAMAIPSLRGKVAYARRLAFPSRAFLDARRGEGHGSYLGRLGGLARWGVSTHRRRRTIAP